MIEQGTAEWHQERLGKVTASQMANVLMAKSTAGYQNYLAQLVCERLTGQVTETFKSAAMEHGNETEAQARASYTMHSGLMVDQVSFVVHPLIPDSGASPDGLVSDKGLVEIKCPQPAKHIKTLLGGKIDRNYMLQMHWQMACTGREWCDFVSFCPMLPYEMQIHVERVEFDPDMKDELETAVIAFLDEVKITEARLKSAIKEAA